ncbi:MAG: fibro-slime domain-containing protein [Oscillospiraceae bacterium]|nr:fibro-slime domain-containing protein [Oscillospiraceae bacterium]
MNAMNVIKKTAAVVLSAAVALGSLSYSNIVSEGADVTLGSGTQTGDYISMPITIRDFAADGMLFDMNASGESGTVEIADNSSGVVVPTPSVKFRPSDSGSISNTYFTKSSQTGEGGYLRFTTSHTTTTNSVMTFYMPSGTTRGATRYLVIKYRTSAAAQSGQTPIIYQRNTGGTSYGNINFPTTGYNKTTWTTAVIDLTGSSYTASDGVGYVTFYPRIAYNKYIDIAYAAFFSDKTDAQTYADYYANSTDYDTTVVKKTYIVKNNAGYGLIFTNANSQVNNMTLNTSTTPWTTTGTINGSQFYINNATSTSVTPQTVTLNSGATMTGYGGLLRLDLVEGELGEGKQLTYTEGTVTYVAEMLQETLPVDWENADGTRNLHHVMGMNLFNDSYQYVGPNASGATKDLADVLRNQITGGLGSYADAKAKNPKSYTDIETYFDAAYFLLHNTFSDSTGYGQTISQYNSLRLLEKKKDDGTTFYTFNSAYNDTMYDTTNGVIYNTQTTTATARDASSGGIYYNRGNIVPLYSFNPVGDLGYGITTQFYYEYLQHISGTTYGADLTNYYSNTNFNFSLEGHAQFVYYEDDDLYFTFTGDDDVYLFINGKRVLDLGGGHAIAKSHIELNDMKSVLGLEDGKVYDFDFYYMERGGGAGNFGIETNMKIVEPSMVTNMLGYQNGVTTGYNGFVDPSKNVGYGYELTNSGNEPITNLTFTNAAIGVSLTPSQITLNSRSNIAEMYVVTYNADGTVKSRYNAPNLTEDVLKALLAAGIDAGEKFGVYGVKYDITNEDWSAGGDTFTNTVKTTADSRDNVTLNGYAEWKVQKRNYSYDCFDIYDWLEPGTQQGVTVTKAELLKPITDAGQTVDASAVSIVLCSPSGNTDTTALSENAVLNSDGSITYTGAKAGVENIYYKVTGGTWENVVFHYHAYTYDVTDDAFVLDYGLPVELFDASYGFLANDKAILAENTKTAVTVVGTSDATSNYGSFTYGGTSLKYTPNKFMSGLDSVTVTIRVMETDATSLTKFTGVEMTQSIKVMPANVVYYEDDFAGLTYLNNSGNKWQLGAGSSVQSPDQNANYGSDPVYNQDNGATDSNGTVSTLHVSATADVLRFSFVGTGFELVSRTTYEQYAVIDVAVTDANGNVVRRMPVITESKGGHLYQVPVISITGLDKGSYTVTVKAGGSTADKVRMLYIDGIRVFNPLADSDAKIYYNPGEYNASFLEIKQLIEDGKTMYANASESSSSLQFATGTTLIEDVESNGVLKSVSSLSQYMTLGPNNEIYLDGDAAVGMIALYLTPDASVTEGSRTIQIGAHRKVDSVNGSNGYVTMTYGSTAADIVSGTNSYKLYNGTEQYYTIDVSRLTLGEDGRYLLMIGTNGSESQGEVLSLTSLKLAGYTISSMEAVLVNAAKSGDLSDTTVVNEAAQIYNYGSEQTLPTDGE